MTAYYNEHDPFAAAWLRNLVAAGVIAPGDVDERSIEDVVPVELQGYRQCHFFAGIGVWSYGMRRAGWADDRRAWTGSCPCQPFSQSGKRAGFADERHLWPAFFHLIGQCGPDVVFGEQVASKDGYAWLDLVQSDMEAAGYAFGALVAPAAGFGAPHIRHRTYWMADAGSQGLEEQRWRPGERQQALATRLAQDSCARGVADAIDGQLQETGRGPFERTGQPRGGEARYEPVPTNGFWADVDWLACRDERWRPVEPGTFPLAHGAANRVGRLRGYGNAIVAPQAEEFIRMALEFAP